MEYSNRRRSDAVLRKAPAWFVKEIADLRNHLGEEPPTTEGVPTEKLRGEARRLAERMDAEHAAETACDRVRRVGRDLRFRKGRG